MKSASAQATGRHMMAMPVASEVRRRDCQTSHRRDGNSSGVHVSLTPSAVHRTGISVSTVVEGAGTADCFRDGLLTRSRAAATDLPDRFVDETRSILRFLSTNRPPHSDLSPATPGSAMVTLPSSRGTRFSIRFDLALFSHRGRISLARNTNSTRARMQQMTTQNNRREHVHTGRNRPQGFDPPAVEGLQSGDQKKKV
jgi:hypothetical protein